MNKLITLTLAPAVAFAAAAIAPQTAQAASPVEAKIFNPGGYSDGLPVFGMRTFNNGYGERIVSVRRGGLAWRLGLERGDTIERINRFGLRYHGSWWDGLERAVDRGGHIVLWVRDWRSGRLVTRRLDCGGVDPYEPGPITPKVVVTPKVVAPICDEPVYPGPGFPGGPVTPKLLTPKAFPAPPVGPKLQKLPAPPVADFGFNFPTRFRTAGAQPLEQLRRSTPRFSFRVTP